MKIWTDHTRPVFEPLSLYRTPSPPPELCWVSRVDAEFPGTEIITPFQKRTLAQMLTALRLSKVFFLGDGPGVGKGRVLAGLARLWRKHVGGTVHWVTANLTLASAAKQELARVGGVSLARSVSVSSYATFVHPFPTKRTALFITDEVHGKKKENCCMPVLQWICGLSAPVVFSSATPGLKVGMEECWRRLGVYGDGTGFSNWGSFAREIESTGAAGLELVSLDLKRRGVFLCRVLAPGNVTRLQVYLSPEQREMYDKCAGSYSSNRTPAGSNAIQFFRMLNLSLMMSDVLRYTDTYVNAGVSVIFSLKMTGACAENDHDSGCCALQRCARRCGIKIPANCPPDCLTQVLSHYTPELVAEITGRRTQVWHSQGVQHTRHKPSNRTEIRGFLSRAKNVAIVSATGSTGIDVQPKGGRVLHVVLELCSSSADTFIQQCGRSNRAYNPLPPEYVIPMTGLLVERTGFKDIGCDVERLYALSRGCRDCPFQCLKERRTTKDMIAGMIFELSVRLVFSMCSRKHDPHGDLEHIPACLDRLRPGGSRLRRERLLANRIQQHLRGTSGGGSESLQHLLVACLSTIYRCRAWITEWVRGSGETVEDCCRRMTPTTAQVARTVLNARTGPLRNVPPPLRELIVAYAAGSCIMTCPTVLYRELEGHLSYGGNLPRRALDNLAHSLPVLHQKDVDAMLVRAAREIEHEESEHDMVEIGRHLMKKNYDLQCAIRSVEKLKNGRLRLTCTFSVPERTTITCLDLIKSDGRLVETVGVDEDGYVICAYPGRRARTFTLDATMLGCSVPRDAYSQARTACTRYRTANLKVARRISGTYTISTVTALADWNNSTQRIVYGTSKDGYAFSGLLIGMCD